MSDNWYGYKALSEFQKKCQKVKTELSKCQDKCQKVNKNILTLKERILSAESSLKEQVEGVKGSHNHFFYVKRALNAELWMRLRQLYMARWDTFKLQVSVMVITTYRFLQETWQLIKEIAMTLYRLLQKLLGLDR